jgi:3',5'-cyclic AMP phosphodiesterase CpdA
MYAISDLHEGLRQSGDRAIQAMADHVNAEGRPEDVLLVGGDIAIDDSGIRQCLRRFSGFPGKKGAVAGNHDIWVSRREGRDSFERHRRVQELFRRHGFTPLEMEPLVVGDVGFVGAMGWYDGSFKDPGLGIDDRAYATKTPPWSDGPVWNDAYYAMWHASDAEVAVWQEERLRDRLEAVRGVREVVAILHHLPTSRLLPWPRFRRLVPKRWRFANAFLGSERFAEVLGREPAVRTVLCGHVHRAASVRLGHRRYHSIGGDYDRKQLLVIEDGRIERRTFTV